jgi:hypothetical protein
MSLITSISSIVSALSTTSTYILSSKFNANLKSFSVSSTALPLIILDNELSKQCEIKENNNVMRQHRILISFLTQDDLDNTDAQTNTAIETMEALADKTAAQIFQLLPVRPDPKQQYTITPMFHVFNTNLSGVALEMQVKYNTIINFKLPVVTP